MIVVKIIPESIRKNPNAGNTKTMVNTHNDVDAQLAVIKLFETLLPDEQRLLAAYAKSE